MVKFESATPRSQVKHFPLNHWAHHLYAKQRLESDLANAKSDQSLSCANEYTTSPEPSIAVRILYSDCVYAHSDLCPFLEHTLLNKPVDMYNKILGS